MTLTVREQFLVKLFTVRPAKADAIVVLCGEDAAVRIAVGHELFRLGYAPTIVVSGGRDDGSRLLGADRAYGLLMGRGIAHDRIVVDTASQNTKEQADAIAGIVAERGWKRILVVASSYHLPRAFLTFLGGSFADLVPVAAGAPWNECPEGMDVTRSELLTTDIEKCATYASDVASWSAGLKALEAL
jgi:uncharacterized SAM-binding protein YcdF (DUF218 family)